MSDKSYTDEIASKIRLLIDPSKLPADGLDELFDSYALLALSKGSDVTNEDVHDAWSIWASKFDSNNPSIKPYDELDTETKSEDTIFTDAIRKVSKSL